MKRGYWPTAAWQSSDPQAAGVDPACFPKLEQVISSHYSNLNALLIVRKGFLIYEKYFNHYTSADPQTVASVTKSVTSALIGIAVDEGLLKSIDEKVLDFFPDYPISPNDFIKRSVTIRQLLTMTAPFAFSWKEGQSHSTEPLDRLRRQPDWVRYALDQMGQNSQPGVFQYATAGTHLLSAIITRVSGKSAREFANQHLFGPTGMQIIPDHEVKNYSLEEVFGKELKGWLKDPQGISAGGWGLMITPQDMARFGYLYLNKGAWDGRQVISEQWVETSTAPNPNQYGYLWRLKEEQGTQAYQSLGSGGNVICVIPEKDLVVVIASSIINRPRDRCPLISDYILPALIN